MRCLISITAGIVIGILLVLLGIAALFHYGVIVL